ncbi:MAG TPA: GxGYxYP domain-containing protein, partial [Armatimonadota bacterium]|nr:GxGYxYP domain-containing protein [Armatimonadota bacterium]
MRFLTLLLAVAAILGTAALPARAAEAWQLDVSGSSYDEECLTYCLQGLVNRDAPRLFLNTASIFWSYPDADRYWLRYLEEKKGFHFTRLENLRAAIAAFRGEVKGLALYDPAQDASCFVALTLCAQRNLLPVTPAMLQYQTPALAPGSAECFRDLPVVEDLRGRFPDDLAAYRWALKNLMPACSKELAFSAGHSHDDTFLGGDRAITIGLDYPIAQKAFVFNLSPVGGRWMNSG